MELAVAHGVANSAVGAREHEATVKLAVPAKPQRPTGADSQTARDRASSAIANTDQARKMRVAIGFVAACSIAAIIGLRVVRGDAVARMVFQAGLGVVAFCCLWAFWHLRTLSHFNLRLAFVLAHVGALGANAAFYFWGVFSGAIVVVPAAALLIAHAVERWRTASLALHYMGGHAALALLQIFGVIADRGYTQIDPVGDKGIAVQLVRLALIQFIMLGGFVVAYRLRRESERSMGELDKALRKISARDALLVEAELARAEVLAINAPGRYSGETVGDFQLGLVIGRGGLGVVYDATNRATGESAAVKVLHPHILAKPDQFRRFSRELEIASELRSPNIVAVCALADKGDAFPFLAMERLYGQTLAEYLGTGAMENGEVIEMLDEVAKGLTYAHTAGVVHRDVKPGNLFRLDQREGGVRWKILDFGACREVDSGHTVTELGTILGTPGYMAPEQARGNRVDGRADTYALAVVAYRAITGRPAYAARELPRLLQDIAYAMPPRPTSVCSAPADLDWALAIGLAKRPYERFASAAELAEAIAAALDGQLSAELAERGQALIASRPWRPGQF